MNRAKDCTRPGKAWLLACLAICLCPFEFGCAGFGGLQSVGTWPPFAHMWERGPGSPSPENDTYAQAMRPTLGLDPQAGQDKKPAKADAPAADSRTRATASTSETGSNSTANGESPLQGPQDARSGVQVTLGQPEPLPGTLLAARTEAARPASESRGGWRPARKNPVRDADTEREPAAQPMLADRPAEPAAQGRG